MVHWTHQPHADIKNKEAHCNDSLYRNKNQPNSTMHARLLLKGIVEMTLLYCQFSTPSLHLDDVILVLWTSSISLRRKKNIVWTYPTTSQTYKSNRNKGFMLAICVHAMNVYIQFANCFFLLSWLCHLKTVLQTHSKLSMFWIPLELLTTRLNTHVRQISVEKRKHEAKKHTLSRKKTVLSIE